MMEHQLEHKMLTFNAAELSLEVITLFGFFHFRHLVSVNNSPPGGGVGNVRLCE